MSFLGEWVRPPSLRHVRPIAGSQQNGKMEERIEIRSMTLMFFRASANKVIYNSRESRRSTDETSLFFFCATEKNASADLDLRVSRCASVCDAWGTKGM